VVPAQVVPKLQHDGLPRARSVVKRSDNRVEAESRPRQRHELILEKTGGNNVVIVGDQTLFAWLALGTVQVVLVQLPVGMDATIVLFAVSNARQKSGTSNRSLWEERRNLFRVFLFSSMQKPFEAIVSGIECHAKFSASFLEDLCPDAVDGGAEFGAGLRTLFVQVRLRD